MSLKQPLLNQTEEEEYMYYENDSTILNTKTSLPNNHPQFQYTLHGIKKAKVDQPEPQSTLSTEKEYLLGSKMNDTPLKSNSKLMVGNVQNANEALQEIVKYRNSLISKEQESLKDIESYVSSLKSEITQLKDQNKILQLENDSLSGRKSFISRKHIICTVASLIPLLLLVTLFIVLILVFGKELFCKAQS